MFENTKCFQIICFGQFLKSFEGSCHDFRKTLIQYGLRNFAYKWNFEFLGNHPILCWNYGITDFL